MTSKLTSFLRAIALLFVVAVAVPWLLLWAADRRFGGAAPWSAMPPPGEWSASTIRDALTDRLSEATIADIVIRLSLTVVWLAVVVLLVTVVAELVHMARHRGIAMPDIRGLGPSQDLARLIAAGLLVIVPLLSASTRAVADDQPLRLPAGRAPATAEPTARPDNAWIDDEPARSPDSARPVATPPHSAGVTPAAALPDRSGAAAGTYTVRPGDSVYGIAERFAGPDQRAISAYANRLLDLNLGQRMVDGQLFTNAAYVDVGWVLQLPPTGEATDASVGGSVTESAAGAHVVETGETLWSIAEDELGDATRWPEIYAANEGRTFDDGRRLTDPDLIQPGWDLDVPGDASPDAGAPGSADVEDADGAGTTGSTVPTRTPAAPVAVPVDAAAPVDAGRAAPKPDNAWVVASAPTDSDGTVDNADLGGLADAMDAENAAGTADLSEVADPAGVAGPADTMGADGADETDISGSAGDNVPSSPAVGDAPIPATVDAAADAGADTDGAPSDAGVELLTFERAAMLSAGLLTLLAVRRRNRMRRTPPNARLPEPQPAVVRAERSLRSIDAGDRFARVDIAIRAAALPLIEHDARVVAVAIGPDGDLELWASASADLDAPWEPGADGTRWHLPGTTPIELLAADARRVGAPCPTLVQLGTCDDGRDLYVDLEALEAIEIGGPGADADAIVAAVAATLSASVLAEVTTLVGVGVDDDAFFGHRHHRPARSMQEAFAVAADAVGTTARAERSTFDLRARVTSGEAWEPAVVLAGAAAGTVTPPASRTGLAVMSASPILGPSSRLAPEDGTWVLRPLGIRLTPIGLTPDDIAALAAVAEVPEAERHADLHDDVHDDGHDVRHDADRTMAPSEHPDHPELIVRDDGGSADVDPLEYSLVVRLLGPVSVESAGGRTIDFERSKTKELIAWLATHRDRSTRSNARAALWELDVRDATFSNVVSEARRAMARCVEPPEGEEWLGRTLTDALPLHRLVVTDVDLVEQALDAARLQPPDLAIETLRGALKWITGVPFEGTSYLWPDAEGITSALVLRAITLTTALADHCLSIGDLDGVFEATSRGLQVLPAHEDMIAVRMRAYAKIGDRAGVRHEWESYERAITTDPWSDGEPSPKMLDLRRDLL